MSMRLSFCTIFAVGALVFGGYAIHVPVVQAATCSITTDTVIDQQYVTDNACTGIELSGNVSTTWLGAIDLGGGTVTISSGTTTVGENSQMILGPNDELSLLPGAALTHASGSPSGLQITAKNVGIAEGARITADGAGCAGGAGGTGEGGYGPNLVTGVCELNGAGAGRFRLGGAGYGGEGGTGYYEDNEGIRYGTSTIPTLLGSGGAAEVSPMVGGNGGGYIRLTVSGSMTNNGVISANGGNGSVGNGGGGSGGSVYLRVRVLLGTGYVSANGGDGDSGSGGGGGGRIAIYTDDFGLVPERINALKGYSGAGAVGIRPQLQKNGTVFILNRYVDDGAGDVLVRSGMDFNQDFDTSRTSFDIQSGADLACGSSIRSLDFTATTWVDRGSSWVCDAVSLGTFSVSSTHVSIENADWRISSASSVGIVASQDATTTGSYFTFSSATSAAFLLGDWQPGTQSTSWSLPARGVAARFDFSSSSLTLTQFHLTLGASDASGTSQWVIPEGISLSFVSSTVDANVSSTLSSFSIDEQSSLTANAKGCIGGYATAMDASGYGPDPVTGACVLGLAGAGHEDLGAAGYGGVGGDGWFTDRGGSTYGSSTYPNDLGSGGAAGGGPEVGGTGGGRIRLLVDHALVIDGQIQANGGSGQFGGGGGSGGTVFLQAGSLEGAGTIAANGGDGVGSGGGGGGGRVGLFYHAAGTFNVASPTVSGGVKGPGDNGNLRNGAAGTLYTASINLSPTLPSTLGPSGLVTGAYTGAANPSFSFSLSDPDLADTVGYRLQVDDTSDFSSPVVDYTSSLDAQGTQTFQVGQPVGGGSYSVGSSGQTLTDGAYYWRVLTFDEFGAASSYITANSGAVAFSVDTVAPGVSEVTATATSTGALITWSTDELSSSRVVYSVSGSYASSTSESDTDAEATTSHRVLITNLLACVTYNYKVISRDSALNATTSTNAAFTTAGCPGGATIIAQNATAVSAAAGATFGLGLEDFRVRLIVPIGYASDDATFQIKRIDRATVLASLGVPINYESISGNHAFDFHALTDEGGVISSFLAPIQVEISYSTEDIGDLDEDSLRIYRNDDGVWYPLSGCSIVKTGIHRIICTTTSFSTFSVFGQRASVSSGVTGGGVSGGGGGLGNTFVQPLALASANLDVWINGSNDSSTSISQNTIRLEFNANPATVKGYAVSLRPDFAQASIMPYVSSTQLVLPEVSGTSVIYTKFYSSTGDASEVIARTVVYRAPFIERSSSTTTKDLVRRDAQQFSVTLSDEEVERLAAFIESGTSQASLVLGMGERRAVVRDVFDTIGRAIPVSEIEKLVQGESIPNSRNLGKERVQLVRIREVFRKIYGHDPNFNDTKQNLAWNTLMYRIRFPRDIEKEKRGISRYKQMFGRAPVDPFQWAVVRVLGYAK